MRLEETYVTILKRENRELIMQIRDLKKEIERLNEIIAIKEEVKGPLVYPSDIED